MRIARYLAHGQINYGAVEGDSVKELSASPFEHHHFDGVICFKCVQYLGNRLPHFRLDGIVFVWIVENHPADIAFCFGDHEGC